MEIQQIAVPLLLLLAGAWVTYRFAAKRAHNETITKQKLDAYSTIFSSLRDLEQWYDYEWNKWFLENMDDGQPYLEDSHYTYEYYMKASEDLFRAVARTEYLMSPEVAKLFSDLRKVMDGYHKDKIERVTEGRNAVLETNEKLMKVAVRELGRAGAASSAKFK